MNYKELFNRGLIAILIILQWVYVARAVTSGEFGLNLIGVSGPGERSAHLAFGEEFGNYIQFLRASVPEDQIVAIPPSSEHIALGHTGLMQYFLFPRLTTNCPADQRPQKCLEQIGGSGVYVLRVGGFPGDQIRSRLDKPYLPFNDGWGLYLPTAEENSRR